MLHRRVNGAIWDVLILSVGPNSVRVLTATKAKQIAVTGLFYV